MTNMERISKSEFERFTSYYKLSDSGCKLWNKKLDKDGYGMFYFRKKSRRAHRVAYYIIHGDIPDGMFVDHICKNRNCVEPSHLRIVTPKQNSVENSLSVGAINAQKTLCKNGHKFDRKYGNQRYCSICMAEKKRRLTQKWREQANSIKC